MIREGIDFLRESVDEVVGIFAPEAQKKRVAHRFQAELMKREYEAAARGRRMNEWRAGRKHPSVESDRNATIEERARDLVRNDGYARRGQRVLSNYLVGSGIAASIRGKDGKKDEELTAVFNAWGRTVGCDARKRNNFFGIQALVAKEMITAGEVLVLKRNVPVERGSGKIPLELLVVESAYLDSKVDNGVDVIQGIEFKDQAPARYHIKNPSQPGSKSDQNSSPVPASDVIHVFDEERPGQVRGVSWFAPVVIPLRDLDIYRDAELTRRKTAACFAAFITNSLGEFDDQTRETFAKLEPGTIEFLGPGQDIKFSAPPATTEYGPYAQTELQKIAAGLGVTYEHLSQNLRDVNFSSARIGQIPFLKFIKSWQTQLIVPQFLDPIFEWFREAAILSDGTRWQDVTVEWTLPRVEMLDEQKETDAITSKIRAGLMSQSEAVRSIGGDPDRVMKEIDSDNQTLDAYKIILDTDPRKVTKAGIIQTSYTSQGGNTIDE